MITGRSSRARRHAKDKPVQYAATDSSEESLSEEHDSESENEWNPGKNNDSEENSPKDVEDVVSVSVSPRAKRKQRRKEQKQQRNFITLSSDSSEVDEDIPVKKKMKKKQQNGQQDTISMKKRSSSIKLQSQQKAISQQLLMNNRGMERLKTAAAPGMSKAWGNMVAEAKGHSSLSTTKHIRPGKGSGSGMSHEQQQLKSASSLPHKRPGKSNRPTTSTSFSSSSYYTYSILDFHEEILSWDIAEAYQKEQNFRNKTKEKVADDQNSGEHDQVPDTFSSHEHYFSVWKPLAVREIIAQTLNKLSNDGGNIKVYSVVAKEMTSTRSPLVEINIRFLSTDDGPSVQHNTFYRDDFVLLTTQKNYLADVLSSSSSKQAPKGMAVLALVLRTGSYLHIRLLRSKWRELSGSEFYLARLDNLVPSLREFSALLKSKDYPLMPLLLNGQHKPSTTALDTLGIHYVKWLESHFNSSQLKAIEAAATSDGFTLIKGPPGTGKTTTLKGLLNSIHLREYNRYYNAVLDVAKRPDHETQEAWKALGNQKPHIIVTAPSNIAVDNIVTKIMEEGFCDGQGRQYFPHIVRVGRGRSDFLANVSMDVLIDRLLKLPSDEVDNTLWRLRDERRKVEVDAVHLRVEFRNLANWLQAQVTAKVENVRVKSESNAEDSLPPPPPTEDTPVSPPPPRADSPYNFNPNVVQSSPFYQSGGSPAFASPYQNPYETGVLTPPSEVSFSPLPMTSGYESAQSEIDLDHPSHHLPLGHSSPLLPPMASPMPGTPGDTSTLPPIVSSPEPSSLSLSSTRSSTFSQHDGDSSEEDEDLPPLPPNSSPPLPPSSSPPLPPSSSPPLPPSSSPPLPPSSSPTSHMSTLNPSDDCGSSDDTPVVKAKTDDDVVSKIPRNNEDYPGYRDLAQRLTGCLERLEELKLEIQRYEFIRRMRNSSSSNSGHHHHKGNHNNNKQETRMYLETSFLDSAHVVFTTLSSAGLPALDSSMKFDVLVVDEAAQAVELSNLIPMRFQSRQCVLVGDPQQLSATTFSQSSAATLYERSLFERLEKCGHPVHWLQTQYRSHPKISKFPRSFFYDGKVEDGSNVRDEGVYHKSYHDLGQGAFQPLVFYDLRSSREDLATSSLSKSRQNQAEAQLTLNCYLTLKHACPKGDIRGKVGIITPYSQQQELLRRVFGQALGTEGLASEVEINTVDGYQGREKDIIILSTVRADPRAGIGFVSDIRRMNVALTRAKFACFIIGSERTLRSSRPWKEFLDFVWRERAVVVIPDPECNLLTCEAGQETHDRSSHSSRSRQPGGGHRPGHNSRRGNPRTHHRHKGHHRRSSSPAKHVHPHRSRQASASSSKPPRHHHHSTAQRRKSGDLESGEEEED